MCCHCFVTFFNSKSAGTLRKAGKYPPRTLVYRWLFPACCPLSSFLYKWIVFLHILYPFNKVRDSGVTGNCCSPTYKAMIKMTDSPKGTVVFMERDRRQQSKQRSDDELIEQRWHICLYPKCSRILRAASLALAEVLNMDSVYFSL